MAASCSICLESVDSTSSNHIILKDYYHLTCLKTLYLQAFSDESLYPPRIGTIQISLDIIEKILTSNEIEMIRKKEKEFELLGKIQLDEEDERMIEQLKNLFNYQQCTKCKRLCEKISGCNHLICRCGHEYCYRCGEKWKGRLCGHGI